MTDEFTSDPAIPGRLARHSGLISVVVAAALWGLGGTVAGNLFARGAAPLEVVAVRTWTSVAVLFLIMLWRGRGSPAAYPPWRPTLGFGVSVAVANAGLFLAINRLPVAVALVLQNLAPAFVIAWAAVTTRRLPAVRVVIGLIVALTAVAFVVKLPTTPLAKLDLLGIFFGLLTAAGVAAFSGFGSTASRASGALPATTWAFAISGVFWLVYQMLRGTPTLFHRPDLLIGAIAVGVFGTLVPFLLFSWGAARVGATVGAINISLEPIFGAALAWVWLGQQLSLTQLFGVAVLLIALIDVQRISQPTEVSPDRRSGAAPQPAYRRAEYGGEPVSYASGTGHV